MPSGGREAEREEVVLVRGETPTTEPVHGLRLSPGMETEIQLPFREPGSGTGHHELGITRSSSEPWAQG